MIAVENPFDLLPDDIYLLARQNSDSSWDILGRRSNGDCSILYREIPYKDSADILEHIRQFLGLTVEEIAIQGSEWRNWVCI